MNRVAKNHRPTVRRIFTRSNGYLIVIVMVLTVVLGVIGLSIAQTVSVKYAKTKRDIAASSATYTAEAGVSDTVAKLTADPTFTGYSTPKTYYSDATKGKATYTSVVTGNGTTRKIIVTGQAYRTVDSTTPLVTRKIQVILQEKTGAETSGPAITPYTVYAGSAGLSVTGGSRMFGEVSSQGDTYIKGKLTVTGNSDAPLYPYPFFSSTPAKLFVNNIACTSGTTYPVACASPDQPITVSSDSAVNGVVCAPGQTASLAQITQPGLQNPCTSPKMSDASFDKGAYTTTMTAPSKASSLTASRCSSTVGEITWTDKTTYTGTLDTSTRDCDIKLQGNVYIKGNLTLGAGTSIIQPYALRETPLTIVVDGTVTLSGTNFKHETTSSGGTLKNGALIRVISFASSDATCSGHNSCNTRLTSTARKNYETTANVRCINSCRVATSLLWSYHGTVQVDSDSEAGMVNGQGVVISNDSSAGYLWEPNATPNTAFGDGTTMPYGDLATDIIGGSAGWKMTDYRQIYD